MVRFRKLESNIGMDRVRRVRYEKLTVLFFGEGGKEKRFFAMLENSRKFRDLLPHWAVTPDHAQGESCEVILNKCIASTANKSFDVVLCFIDLDKLNHDFGVKGQAQKLKLEEKAREHNIHIIWQDQDHEQELSRAAGRVIGKDRLKQLLKTKSIEIKIVNSPFVKRIMKTMVDYEHNL